jgi:hypothetical protein
MNTKKTILIVISLSLVAVNLITFLYLIFFDPIGGYFGSFWFMIPIMWVILISNSIIPIFLLTLIFLSVIGLTIVRLYWTASNLCFVAGAITFPIGILGIIASILIYEISILYECPFCGQNLIKDRRYPKIGYCPLCKSWFEYRS